MTCNWIQEFGAEYLEYMQQGNAIRELNRTGDYSQGRATTNGNGDFVVLREVDQ